MDTPEEIKIWQRVRNEVPPVPDGLSGLAANALALSSLYGNLARQLPQGRKILLQLQEEALSAARSLKGIYQLVTGVPMEVGAVPPTFENAQSALRKSYGQTLKVLRAYEARESHPEYGCVFAQLAAAERRHCGWLTELMGLLGV